MSGIAEQLAAEPVQACPQKPRNVSISDSEMSPFRVLKKMAFIGVCFSYGVLLQTSIKSLAESGLTDPNEAQKTDPDPSRRNFFSNLPRVTGGLGCGPAGDASQGSRRRGMEGVGRGIGHRCGTVVKY